MVNVPVDVSSNIQVVNPDNGDIKNKSVPIVISAPFEINFLMKGYQ